MEITITLTKRMRALAVVRGKFNIEAVPHFEEKMQWLFGEKVKSIAFDFKKLQLIDSSGIGSLIKALNIAKNREIDFILFNVSEEILTIFSVSYLDKFFIIKSEEEVKKLYPDFHL